MTSTFTLFDIENLVKSFNNATIAHDCLAPFLNSYTFDSVYETDDNSLVFNADGANSISIEFFNFENPVARTMSIMYYENRKPVILHY